MRSAQERHQGRRPRKTSSSITATSAPAPKRRSTTARWPRWLAHRNASSRAHHVSHRGRCHHLPSRPITSHHGAIASHHVPSRPISPSFPIIPSSPSALTAPASSTKSCFVFVRFTARTKRFCTRKKHGATCCDSSSLHCRVRVPNRSTRVRVHAGRLPSFLPSFGMATVSQHQIAPYNAGAAGFPSAVLGPR